VRCRCVESTLRDTPIPQRKGKAKSLHQIAQRGASNYSFLIVCLPGLANIALVSYNGRVAMFE